MVLSLFILLAAAGFALQLTLCIQARRKWIKLAPVSLILVMDAACWIAYFLDIFSEIYDAAFASFVYGVILLLVLAVDLLAWVVYGIVKLIQKRKK